MEKYTRYAISTLEDKSKEMVEVTLTLVKNIPFLAVMRLFDIIVISTVLKGAQTFKEATLN